jgi:hypothetical protein
MPIAQADRPFERSDAPAREHARGDRRVSDMHDKVDPRIRQMHDPRGIRGGARNVGDEAQPPLLNPNTSHQPTVGASSTPTEDRLLGLQDEQAHAWRALNTTVPALRGALEASDDPGAPDVLAALEVAQETLASGGDLGTLETAAADYEHALAAITPTLTAGDLAALNSVLTSILYIGAHMRADDVLPALPEDVVGTGEEGEGSGGEGAPGAPTVVDVPHVEQAGTTLSCTMGNWTGEPTSYGYAWSGVAGTAATYEVQPADVGVSASCVVTATNASGSTTAPPSNSVVVT